MRTHCAAAGKVVRELDTELATSSKRAGRELIWDAADRAVLELIASEIGRKVDLAADYETCEELKSRVKASANAYAGSNPAPATAHPPPCCLGDVDDSTVYKTDA